MAPAPQSRVRQSALVARIGDDGVRQLVGDNADPFLTPVDPENLHAGPLQFGGNRAAEGAKSDDGECPMSDERHGQTPS
jgi:hypothetical protein